MISIKLIQNIFLIELEFLFQEAALNCAVKTQNIELIKLFVSNGNIDINVYYILNNIIFK